MANARRAQSILTGAGMFFEEFVGMTGQPEKCRRDETGSSNAIRRPSSARSRDTKAAMPKPRGNRQGKSGEVEMGGVLGFARKAKAPNAQGVYLSGTAKRDHGHRTLQRDSCALAPTRVTFACEERK